LGYVSTWSLPSATWNSKPFTNLLLQEVYSNTTMNITNRPGRLVFNYSPRYNAWDLISIPEKRQ
jgi:hypothetical protein